MLPIILNGTDYNIPDRWDEITLSQLIQFRTLTDEINAVRVLSILTGLDYDILNNFKSDGFDTVINALGFLGEPFNEFELPRKESITIRGKVIPVITKPDLEKIGQKLMMQGYVNRCVKNKVPHCTMIAMVVAIYYAPKLREDGLFKEADLDVLITEIEQMRVVDVYPEASFFLSGLITYVQPKQEN